MTSTRQRTLRIAVFAVVAALALMATSAIALAGPGVAFGTPSLYGYAGGATGAGHSSVVVDFFTNGLAPDVIVPNGTHNNLSLFTNNGSGGFGPATTIANSALNFGAAQRPSAASFLATAGAINPNLLVTNQGDDSVAVLLGDGLGGFAAASPATVSVGAGPAGIVSFDFNADGADDFATCNSLGKSVTVKEGQGDGTFSNPTTQPASLGAAPFAIELGDFNKDGIRDLAVSTPASDSVHVLLGNGTAGVGTGTFREASGSPFPVFAGASPSAITVGDFNRDGNPDVITSNATGDSSHELTWMMGDGAGGLHAQTSFASGNVSGIPAQIASGILQSDPTTTTQYPAAVTPAGQLPVHLNNYLGDGGFLAPPTLIGIGAGAPVSAVTVDDVAAVGTRSIITAGDDFLTVVHTSVNPPETIASSDPANALGAWVSQNVTVTLTASDPNGPGIASTFYQLNGLPVVPSIYTSGFPFTVSAEGTTTLDYWSVDTNGFAETTNTAFVRIDRTPPTISLSGIPAVTPPASLGWTNQQVTVTLNPLDTYSGIANSFFTINGSAAATYTVPLIFLPTLPPSSLSGTQTVTASTVDNVGLPSTTATATFGLDAVVPSTTLHPWGVASTGWINASSTPGGWSFTRVEDGLSPMHSRFWLSVNGAPLVGPASTSVPSTYTYSGEGTLAVSYQTTDLAGNVETTQTALDPRDTQFPTTTITGIPGSPTAVPVVFGLPASDPVPGSGVANTFYQIDTGPVQTYAAPVTVSALGTHTVKYWSVDVAGNVESTHTSAAFTVLATPAFTLAYTAGANGSIVGSSTQVVDSGSNGTTVTATPAAGFHFVSWSDGYPTAARRDLNVTANVTASATFAINTISTFTLHFVTDGTAGSTVSSATQTVASGASASPVTATAPSGFQFLNWTGTGSFVTTSTNPLTVTSVTADATMTAHFVAVTPSSPVEIVFDGADRYQTAVLGSRSQFATGSVSTVVIATGENFPDALSSAPLAGAHRSPVLLTRKNALPSAVHDEIVRLGATKAIIVGGTGAVFPVVEGELQTLLGNGNVSRLAGSDRYGTALAVATSIKAKQGSSLDGTVFVATGTNYPDALSSGPNAWKQVRPILLVKGAKIPQATLDALALLKPTRAVILGGAGVIPDATVSTIRTKLTAPALTPRLWGSLRYDTAVAVANWSAAGEGQNWVTLGMATGQNFPDALSGGPISGSAGGVLLLTQTNTLTGSTATAISAHASTIKTVQFFGGSGAIQPGVRTAVMGLLP